jgi:hypothetical protein
MQPPHRQPRPPCPVCRPAAAAVAAATRLGLHRAACEWAGTAYAAPPAPIPRQQAAPASGSTRTRGDPASGTAARTSASAAAGAASVTDEGIMVRRGLTASATTSRLAPAHQHENTRGCKTPELQTHRCTVARKRMRSVMEAAGLRAVESTAGIWFTSATQTGQHKGG